MKTAAIIALIILVALAAHGAAAISTTSCADAINIPGATYYLQNDILTFTNVLGGGRYCYSVGANGITIDCQGHTVWVNSTVGGGDFTKTTDYNSTVVKNCVFQVLGSGSIMRPLGTESRYILIENNTIINNASGTTMYVFTFGLGKLTDSELRDNYFISTLPGAVIKLFQSGGNNNRTVVDHNVFINVSMGEGGTTYTLYPLIFDNIFNRSTISTIDSNANCSTNLTTGFNIVGGRGRAGNYYSSDGTGFSEVCSDVNLDGFCDEGRPYYASTTGTCPDYLPLANYTAGPTVNCFSTSGCLLYDQFNYLDSMTLHGWNGAPVGPPTNLPYSMGEYSCVFSAATPPYIWHYLNGTVSKSDPAFSLSFRLRLCRDDTAPFNGVLATGSTNKVAFRISADSQSVYYYDAAQGGFINDLADVSPANDTSNLSCSGLGLYDDVWQLTGYPAAIPPYYDLYVDGVLKEAHIPFSDAGQNDPTFNYVMFTGGYTGDKCFWYLDDVLVQKDLALGINVTLDQGVGGGVFDSSGNFHREKCNAGENPNLCAARVVFGGVLGWFADAIINNILLSIVFILLLVIAAIIYWRTKN